MHNNDDKRQPRSLAMTASNGVPSPPETIEQLVQRWLQLAAHLSPLIGESGFCALFGRATRLLRPQFDWLTLDQAGKSLADLVAALERDLASVELALARAANEALHNTFIKLLCALIGEALTLRLVDTALAGEFAQKTVQEHK
jgi:hypothetical protein